jgi:hypothetical protein
MVIAPRRSATPARPRVTPVSLSSRRLPGPFRSAAGGAAICRRTAERRGGGGPTAVGALRPGGWAGFHNHQLWNAAHPAPNAAQPGASSSHATFTYPDRNGRTAPDSGS